MTIKNLAIWGIRIKEKFLIWINRIIPLRRILVIECGCFLRQDCTKPMKILIINTGTLNFSEILDCVFKSAKKHFEQEHQLKYPFIGLQLKSADQKYTIYLGDVKHE